MRIATLEAILEKRHSEKKNRDYYVIVVHLSQNVTKEVFLEPAELELLLLQINNSAPDLI